MTVILESPTNTQGSVDAYVTTSIDPLRTISEVLDVRTVFPRLSEIANRILPHDALAMGLVDRGGQLCHGGGDRRPARPAATALETLFREDVIIGDLTAEELPGVAGPIPCRGSSRAGTVHCSRPPCVAPALRCSAWRSGRSIHTRTSEASAPCSAHRRHIAVGVSHEQLATAARDDADGRARTSELDAPSRMLTRGIGGAQPRIVGESPAWQEVLRKATQVAATTRRFCSPVNQEPGKK